MLEAQNSSVSVSRSRRFLSLRWKLILPIFILAMPIAMLATYAVSEAVAHELHDGQNNQLVAEVSAVSNRATILGEDQIREAQRVAYTANVPTLTVARNSATLQALVQPLAAAGDLDYLIVAGADGKEIVGLQRDAGTNYMASQDTLLNDLAFVPAVLSGTKPAAFEIDRTERGYVLFTAVPIVYDNRIVGIAATGITLERALQSFGQDAAIYSVDGRLLALTGTLNAPELATVSADVGQSLLSSPAGSPAGNLLFRPLQAASASYRAVYAPLTIDDETLGLIAVFQPDTTLVATDASRRTLSLLLSGLVGAVMVTAFGGLNLTLSRLSRVTRTAQALASGQRESRTKMGSTDEIGELGLALDVYAQRIQENQDALESSLRQQRRETAQLTAVIESIPDGIVVQDLDGRVVLMNRGAFRLLGSKRVFRSSPLNELTAIVTDRLGAALMPGVFSLGDPQRVPLDGKVLQAQAAAVISKTQSRIGTLIVLRDVTEIVNRERERDRLLTKLAEEVDAQPTREREDALGRFVREVNHNAIALQRMISEIRELSLTDAKTVQSGQQALSAETLLWKIAREWQPTANSAGIELHVLILARGLYILGEEHRLRWAIGNLIDNAIKYTPKGGHISLALRADENENYARFLVKDSGVGISAEDLPNVFTRFYRGKPITAEGDPLQVPGSGQGLFIAQRVIEAHGGEIYLKSSPGHGTEALFRLPLTANVTLGLTEPPTVLPDQESVPVEKPRRDDERLLGQ